jgi:hypothetical protein
MLGYARDNVITLKKAIDYLNSPPVSILFAGYDLIETMDI